MDPSFLCKPQTLQSATRIANWCKFEETWDQECPYLTHKTTFKQNSPKNMQKKKQHMMKSLMKKNF